MAKSNTYIVNKTEKVIEKRAKTVYEDVEVEKVTPVKRIILDLSLQEAQALGEIMDRVGGSTCNSPRGFIDNINRALKKQNVKNYLWPMQNRPIGDNYIYFADVDSDKDWVRWDRENPNAAAEKALKKLQAEREELKDELNY